MRKNRWAHTGFTLPFFLMVIASIISRNIYSQSPVENIYESFDLAKDESNIIQNANHLDDFFDKLYRLKLDPKEKISIIHIGDSHIQADYMTDVVRKHLQHDFGNAGRGLIVPCRVAGTNEPSNFRTSSQTSWLSQ